MTTETTLTLPPSRNLAAYGYNEKDDVEDETYSREIQDAIAAGKVIYLLSGGERHGNGTPKQEVCVTRFRDPRAAEVRHAVEIWNDGRMGRYDYADRETSFKEADEWVRMISLRPAS